MPRCPNDCEKQRFVQTVTQSKQVLVNEQGETISCQGVGDPTVSDARCTKCGAEAKEGKNQQTGQPSNADFSPLSCVDEVESGDWKDIDDYKRELREAGFDAEYENVYRSATGATAIVYVNGQEHAVFEMDVTGQIVRDVENTLQQCVDDCDLPKISSNQ